MKAVLRSRRLDTATRLTVSEFANLRNLSSVLSKHLPLDGTHPARHFEKLNILFVLSYRKLARRKFISHLNVLENRIIQALDDVLKPNFFSVDVKQVVHLFLGHQLRLES